MLICSDPRGFSVKFRTAEGNWDFVGEFFSRSLDVD